MTARRRSSLGEWEVIDALRAALTAQPPGRAVALGIGDDAAILRPSEASLVWTVDASVEHVHFERAWLSLADIAYRAVAAAVSDVPAMGAEPVAALLSLVLPPAWSRAEHRRLAAGLAAAATVFRTPVIGGNVSAGPSLELHTTVLGRLSAPPLLRSGARPGDELWLAGELGLAAAGLRLLQQGKATRPDGAARRCLAAWRTPAPQLAAGRALARVAHAALDVSDGLVGDVAHLAEASGCDVLLSEALLAARLSPELVQVAERLGVAAEGLALHGGEDYALVAAGPARRRPRAVAPIGRVIGAAAPGRVWLERRDGSLEPVVGGFTHGGAAPRGRADAGCRRGSARPASR